MQDNISTVYCLFQSKDMTTLLMEKLSKKFRITLNMTTHLLNIRK